MLLAITTCVRASRWVARAVASSALSASSEIHCSRRTTAGSAAPSTRSWWRKRETKAGVSGGGADAKPVSAASSEALPSRPAAASLAAAASAAPISSSRCTVRSAIRRTFSINPRRSMAGTAQSSPMVRTAISWNASTKPLTFSRSIRPSLCEMSVMASS